ncbi:hypothetical protein [Xylella fastidiosa]
MQDSTASAAPFSTPLRCCAADMGIWGYGDMGIWGYGDMGIWGYGDVGMWGSTEHCRKIVGPLV